MKRWSMRIDARLAHSLTLAVLVIGQGAGPVMAQAAGPAGVQPRLTRLPDGLRLEWQTPALAWAAVDGAWRAQLPGFAEVTGPGQPRVPQTAVLIAVPPGATPRLVVESVTETAVTVPGPLALAPRPGTMAYTAAGEPMGVGLAPVPLDEAAAFSPEVVALTPLGVMRGLHLARVMFTPLRPAGAAGAWRLAAQVRVTVHFDGAHPSPPATAATLAAADPLLPALAAQVLNPEDARPVFSAPAPATAPQTAGAMAYVDVASSGLTRLTYEALAAAGVAVAGLNPAQVQLMRAGQPVPLEWQGDGDAAFEPGERFVFYAAPRFSRYAAHDSYALTTAPGGGLRLTTRSGSPAALPAGVAWVDQTVEVNDLYTPDCFCPTLPAGRDGERWAWKLLVNPGAPSTSLAFNVASRNAAQPATLTAWLIGKTNFAAAPDHRTALTLNAIPLGSTDWEGKTAITLTVPLAAGVLAQGANTLQVSLPGLSGVSVDSVWLDAFAVRYALGPAAAGAAVTFTGEAVARAYAVTLTASAGVRAFDITQPDQPVALTGLSVSGPTLTLGDVGVAGPRRYLAVAEAGVLDPAAVRLPRARQAVSGADYIILTHSLFRDALAPLVALRQGQGRTVVVEDVQAVYDGEDGRPLPEAIQAYLANAYATWSPRPAYVLLVGDGAADPRRYRANSLSTFIPPYLADVDPFTDETAADNRYVTVQGNDLLPEMALGRLPVNSLAEAQTIINKIVAYESQPAVSVWNSYLGFVSDNYPDPAGNFPAKSAEWAGDYVSAPFSAQQIVVGQPITSTREAILARWTNGAGLMLYNGHSSVRQWAEERAFHLDDVSRLVNGGRLPVVLELTCFTNMFHKNDGEVLDEALLRRAGGGAVAVWGSSSLGVATGHEWLARGFLNNLYAVGEPDLGEAVLAGKLALAASGSLGMDLIDTFTLLGDPAMRLNLTLVPGAAHYLPLMNR